MTHVYPGNCLVKGHFIVLKKGLDKIIPFVDSDAPAQIRDRSPLRLVWGRRSRGLLEAQRLLRPLGLIRRRGLLRNRSGCGWTEFLRYDPFVKRTPFFTETLVQTDPPGCFLRELRIRCRRCAWSG